MSKQAGELGGFHSHFCNDAEKNPFCSFAIASETLFRDP